jgi:6-phosphogluconolactonase (cycloisomerase 2 family)
MKIRVRALIGLMVVLATMGLVGCGHYTCGTTFGSSSCTPSGSGLGTTGGGGTAFTFFVGAPGTGLLKLDMTAHSWVDITDFHQPTLPVLSGSGGIVVSDKKFLYMPFQNGTLYGFSIDGTTGALTGVNNGNAYAVAGGFSSAIDPAGRFLFVGDFVGQQISAFAVSSTDGTLTSAGAPFATSGVSPVQMATDGQGKYLYVAEGAGGAQVAAFSIDQITGALTAVPGTPFSFNVAQIAGEKSGKYLFGITGTLDNGSSDKSINVFGITQSGNSAGALSAPNVVTTQLAPVNLTVSPNGAFVYTFNEDIFQNLDAMEGFQITSTGLTELQSSPFSNLVIQNGQFEQSGQFMIGVTSFVATAAGSGTFPLAADPATGALTNSIANLGSPLNSFFVVTDAP